MQMLHRSQPTQRGILTEMENESLQYAREFNNVERMRHVAPALFTGEAHPRMSSRYAFTNTYEMVKMMQAKGYGVSSVTGGRTKFSKLMVRLRMPTLYTHTYGDAGGAPELVIVDSHDGTSRLKMYLGWIQFLCMNGLVAGDMIFARSYMHTAPDLMAQVILELQDVGMYVDKMKDRMVRMMKHETTGAERAYLADSTTRERFGEDRDGTFVIDMRRKLLEPRREQDKGTDLYTVVNVIQENALRGGMRYTSGARRLRLADVRSVDKNLSINQQLWNDADAIMLRRAA
jgi:hypothetical protein